MIDTDRIKELEEEIGSEDLGFVLDLFLQEAAETLAGIEADLSVDALTRAMHFLRSGALNIGLRGFAAAAGAIEVEQPGDPVAAAARLCDILERTRAQLASA